MKGLENQGYPSKKFIPAGRIETQIHRRRAIKVFSRLQIEWDRFGPSDAELPRVGPDIEMEPSPESTPETSTHRSQL